MAKKRKTPARAKRKPAPNKGVKAKSSKKARGAVKAKNKSAPARKSTAQRKPASRTGAASAPQMSWRAPPRTMYGIVHPEVEADPSFRDAPEGWTLAGAEAMARAAGLELTEAHREVIRVLQGCYKDEVSPRLRLLRDALEARFRDKGGIKFLYGILPGGPITQGCILAGVKPPAGARDLSFGSVA